MMQLICLLGLMKLITPKRLQKSSAIIFAIGLFDRLTGQIDELAELQQGNVAVAAVMVGVILAVSLLMSRAVEQIIAWFVTFVSGG